MNNLLKIEDTFDKNQAKKYASEIYPKIRNYDIIDEENVDTFLDFSNDNRESTKQNNRSNLKNTESIDYNAPNPDEFDDSNNQINVDFQTENLDILNFNANNNLKDDYENDADFQSLNFNDISDKNSDKNLHTNFLNKDLNFSLGKQKSNIEDEYVNYLSKNKIRQILTDKYSITSKDVVNYLYQKSIVNRWNEINLEKWLLKPSNLAMLKDKFRLNSKNQNLIDSSNEKKLDQTKIESLSSSEDINNKENKLSENKSNQKCSCNYHSHKSPYFDRDYLSFLSQNGGLSYGNHHFKDEMKSVIVDENYRKLQFDLQTEILKNHINDKFFALSNDLNVKGSKQNELKYYSDFQSPDFLNQNRGFLRSADFASYQNKHSNNLEINSSLEPKKESSQEKVKSSIEQEMKNVSLKINDFIKNIESQIGSLSNSFDNKINSLKKQFLKAQESVNEKQKKINEKVELCLNTFKSYTKKETFDSKINQIHQELENKFNFLIDQKTDLSFFENELNDVKNKIYNDLENFKNEFQNLNTNVDFSKYEERLEKIKNDLDDKLEILSKIDKVGDYAKDFDEFKNVFIDEIEKVNFQKLSEFDNTLNNIKEDLSKKFGEFEEKNKLVQKENITTDNDSQIDFINSRFDEIKADLSARLNEALESINNRIAFIGSQITDEEDEIEDLTQSRDVESELTNYESKLDRFKETDSKISETDFEFLDSLPTYKSNEKSDELNVENQDFYQSFLNNASLEDKGTGIVENDSDVNLSDDVLNPSTLESTFEKSPTKSNLENDNPTLFSKSTEIDQVIGKSIGDLSEVIDSLNSLDVNDEIINSFEETSKKFKNI